MKPEPVVHSADTRLGRSKSGRLVLMLALPEYVAGQFVDGLPSVAAKCSLSGAAGEFFVAHADLQVQAYLVSVSVSLYDEKSFSWLEECLSRGSVSYTFTGVRGLTSRLFEALADFSAVRPNGVGSAEPVPFDDFRATF